MNANMELINDVSTLRVAVAQEKHLFNQAGGTKALDAIREQKEALRRQEEQLAGQPPRHAGPDENPIEQTDGVDNNALHHIEMKKQYIANLRQSLKDLTEENARLQARGGNNGFAADNQQQDF